MVDANLCLQQYLTLRPRTGLQTREHGTGKITPDSDIVSAQAAWDEHRTAVFELVNILQWFACVERVYPVNKFRK